MRLFLPVLSDSVSEIDHILVTVKTRHSNKPSSQTDICKTNNCQANFPKTQLVVKAHGKTETGRTERPRQTSQRTQGSKGIRASATGAPHVARWRGARPPGRPPAVPRAPGQCGLAPKVSFFLNPRRPPPKQSGWGSEVIETSYRTFEKLATLANVFVKVLPLISIIIVKLVVCNDSGHAYAHCCASIAARLLRCEYC